MALEVCLSLVVVTVKHLDLVVAQLGVHLLDPGSLSQGHPVVVRVPSSLATVVQLSLFCFEKR